MKCKTFYKVNAPCTTQIKAEDIISVLEVSLLYPPSHFPQGNQPLICHHTLLLPVFELPINVKSVKLLSGFFGCYL